MRRVLAVCAVFFFLLTSLGHTQSKILVKFKSNPVFEAGALFYTFDVKSISTFAVLPSLFEVTLKKNQNIDFVLNQIRKNPHVEYAESDHRVRIIGDDDEDFPFPFPWPPGDGDDGKFPFPFPWPPGDGDDDNPFPWPFPDPGEPSQPGKDPALVLDPEPITNPKEDPDFEKTWGIQKIGSPEAWNISKGSRNVVVAVIDTGIDYNHEDLSLNVWRNVGESGEYKDEKTGEVKRRETDGIDNDNNGFIDDVVGYDFANNDSLPYDDHSHGSHCSGTIGAVGMNGKGTVGVNQEVSIMGLKFLSSQGSGDISGAIKAIDYAIKMGAKVLSNSWGDYEDSQALRDVITEAQKHDVLFVAAAGNDSKNNDGDKPMYPASFPHENIISVAASNEQDRKAFFSNYGKESVDLAAPGSQIYSTVRDNKYSNFDGTSMATPHVAGAAALLLSIHKDLTFKELKSELLESVDKIDVWGDKVFTGGRLNIFKAAESVLKKEKILKIF
ncbi:MAG: S8 family serine peptidase [Deltaproteobacteria bacterium]|nr:S8 family serine peptidase [Deltaproteobacteria bacterium]